MLSKEAFKAGAPYEVHRSQELVEKKNSKTFGEVTIVDVRVLYFTSVSTGIHPCKSL